MVDLGGFISFNLQINSLGSDSWGQHWRLVTGWGDVPTLERSQFFLEVPYFSFGQEQGHKKDDEDDKDHVEEHRLAMKFEGGSSSTVLVDVGVHVCV